MAGNEVGRRGVGAGGSKQPTVRAWHLLTCWSSNSLLAAELLLTPTDVLSKFFSALFVRWFRAMWADQGGVLG